MNISNLKTFVEIVEAGGLTAAANKKGVTQPGLSRIVRDLETRLQVQLLKRTGRGIELTPAGEEFLKFAEDTLSKLAEMQKRIALHSNMLPTHLGLSVPLRVGRLLIPDLYREFNETLPETTTHIFEEPSDRARKMLNEGRLDAALTYRNTPKPDEHFVPIFSESLYAVGHEKHLGHENKPVSLQEVSRLPLLLPSQGRYLDLITSTFRSAGHEFSVARELETTEVLMAFAMEGEGVAILPISNVYIEAARGEVTARQIFEPKISRVVGIQFSPEMPRHVAGIVLRVIRKAMRLSAASADWKDLRDRRV